ncbi:MAG: hypothetical protein ACKVX7_13745 [Planctomycetota bacterium]
MTQLKGIEPFLHLPHGDLCADARTDGDRDRDLLQVDGPPGLRGLLKHVATPISVLNGLVSGVWAPAGKCGFYLHRENFVHESPIEKLRWCVLAALNPLNTCFAPVVGATRVSIDQTLTHLRRAGVDPVGVSALFRDDELHMEKLIEARRGIPPLVDLVTEHGARHQLWCLSAGEGELLAGLLTRLGGALVGDLSLYRALLRARDLPFVSGETWPVVRFYNQRDFGVALAGTVRCYNLPVGLELNLLVERLHRFYDVSEFSLAGAADESCLALRGFLDELRSEGVAHRAIGMLARGTDTAFLIRAKEEQVALIGHENPPYVATQFDAEWLEKGILRQVSPQHDLELVTVTCEAEDASVALERFGAQLAFVLNPPAKRHIPELARSQWRLPVGALQLVPATPRGIVLVPLKPSDQKVTVPRV